MSAPKFEFHPEAILDAWEARRWYADRNPQAADSFMAELDRAAELIIAQPERWPPYLHGTRRYRLRRFPYLLVYRTTADMVVVLAVAHAKRRPGYWKSRRAP